MKNKKGLKLNSAIFITWFAYVIIFFEIIYMATPFAIFFYSVYKVPLSLLSSNSTTSWLTQTIFPHFANTNSLFINTLILISWPLLFIGSTIFLISFIQIYWAKFTQKKAVTTGFYKYIRHPQYFAWILFGFGMSILWSRMIVWIMYITMIFVYYILARIEEKECLQKYPNTYKPYFESTGMFFFRLNKIKIKNPILFPQQNKFKKIVFMMLLYILILSTTIIAGFYLRNYSLNQISYVYKNNSFAISLEQTSTFDIKKILAIIEKDTDAQTKIDQHFNPTIDKKLIYIMPENWSISELGVENNELICNSNLILNPINHGNSKSNHQKNIQVLYSKPLIFDSCDDKDILKKCIIQKPKLLIKIDFAKESIIEVIDLQSKTRYSDIPVPLF